MKNNKENGKKVLLIEDNEIVQKLIKKLLSQREVETVIATTPAQVKSAIVSYSDELALVFIDLIMPELNGWDAIKLLDANTETKDIPIIILTGAMLSQLEREKLLKRAAAIMEKQKLTLDAFNEVVDRWL